MSGQYPTNPVIPTSTTDGLASQLSGLNLGPSNYNFSQQYAPPGSNLAPTNIRPHFPTGPRPTLSNFGPPTSNFTSNIRPPPTSSNFGPSTSNIRPPPTSNFASNIGPPPTLSNFRPPPTGPPPISSNFGPPPTGPPPISSNFGPPPTGPPPISSNFGPPPTGPPPISSNFGPPPTGPPPISSNFGPPTSNIRPPPTSNFTSNIGPPPNFRPPLTGPPPTSSNLGPPPTGPPPTSGYGHQPVTGMTGPTNIATPTTGHLSTAPTAQHYPHQTFGPQPTAGPTPQQLLPELQPIKILENRNLLPSTPITCPPPPLPAHLKEFVPDPAVFCSTMSSVPATSNLLNKMKLPFAIHIHPFKDSKGKECPVINPTVIVRCRVCRAYINPFVSFVDARHWRCNVCFRNNIVPDDYDINPHTGKRGDRSHHAELRYPSIEYIAPSEYMVRPPQPSVYFFVIDVTYPTIESGALDVFCQTLLAHINKLPGDGRTMVGFLTFDHTLNFYNLKPTQAQPQMLVVSDLEDPFVPSPSSLLVNLRECKELVKSFLEDLPRMFADQRNLQSALGPALQVSEKLLHPIGGRITVLISSLPNVGPGLLNVREVIGATKMDQLNMAANSDFYKKLALDCSAQQIAVDLFVFSNKVQTVDLSTISTVAKFSSGQIKYYQNFHSSKPYIKEQFERDFKRYLTRNIGFEAVMRIRCTEGLSLHTFHGNFFVRSTDLLSLPNVNPDHGYCMNMAIDESLKEFPMVCLQAALLYTSYRGERRIRVHTLCLPVSDQPSQLYAGLNIQAIAGVLGKMAADRIVTSSLGDARDALVNTVIDSSKAYRSMLSSSQSVGQFVLPSSLRLLPLFVLGLLKNPALTLSTRESTDNRANAINLLFTLPHDYLNSCYYPKLYALHDLSNTDVIDNDGMEEVAPSRLQLSAEKLTRYGVFLMDYGTGMYIWVNKETPENVVKDIFNVMHFGAITESMKDLPALDNNLSKLVNSLVYQIRTSRQHFMPLLVIREDGPHRLLFINNLIEDKTEDGTSYYEFVSHIAKQITK